MNDFRVIFSAGSQLSSGYLLQDINRELSKHFNLRIAAGSNCRGFVDYIDWNMDALYNGKPNRHASTKEIIGEYYVPLCDKDILEILVEDVKQWGPDLIITDQDPIFLAIANKLKIPVWDISLLNFFWTDVWQHKQTFYTNQLYNFRRDINLHSKADKYFVYSAFYKSRMNLGNHVNWVKPFNHSHLDVQKKYDCVGFVVDRPSLDTIFKSQKIDLIKCERANNGKVPCADIVFCSGENHLINDLILNNTSTIYLIPNINDKEALINASLIKKSRLGLTLGQIENMKYMAGDELYIRSKEKLNSRLSIDSDEKNLIEIIKEEYASKI